MASRNIAKSFEVSESSVLVDGEEFPFAIRPEINVAASTKEFTVVTVGIYVDGPVNVDTSPLRRTAGRPIKDQPPA